jgi:hypothetical protein
LGSASAVCATVVDAGRIRYASSHSRDDWPLDGNDQLLAHENRLSLKEIHTFGLQFSLKTQSHITSWQS